jgi:glycine betaine/choline ABC-type transport system substrate-binding protein
VAPVVSKRLVAQLGPRFAAVVNAVSKKLSQRAMIAMNKAVGVDKRPPAVVARAFLRANKLA